MNRVVRGVSIVCAVLLLAPLSATAAEAPRRIIDVVQVTWPGAQPLSTSKEELARTIETDTLDRWRRMSNGNIVFELGRTFPTMTVSTQLPCDGVASITFMNSVRTVTYKDAGITDDTNRYLIILSPTPTSNCIWDGRGTLSNIPSRNGTIVLKNTADPEIIAHELGHNLGLGHSNLETCRNGRTDDAWSNCSAIEYGSATDLMGNNDRDSVISAYHQWRLGLIADADVAQPRTDQQIQLHPVSDTTGIRAAFVRDGSAAYWIEYRNADIRNRIDPGLVIYRTDPPPGSSVVSPIASDAADPTNSGVTTDVWMINLGNYIYMPPTSSGSPSLPNGTSFTTAFGGTTVSAIPAANGTVTLNVRRAADRTSPTRPELTPLATWRTPTSELVTSDYFDTDSGIDAFDARIADGTGERVVRLAASASKTWQRTYLNPLSPPANLRFGDLPEGKYQLSLRGVDAAGNASPWTDPVAVAVDRGAPIVTAAFDTSVASDARTATLRWTGATDKGAGICAARAVNPDGFVLQRWQSDAPGIAEFQLERNTTVDATGQVFDCLGNGVQGNLRLSSTFITPSEMRRTGTWQQRSNGWWCVTTCTAAFTTPGKTALLMRQGSATLRVAGRAISIPAGRTSALRTVFVAAKDKQLVLSGSRFLLVGGQSVSMAWTQTGLANRIPIAADTSLEEPDQQQLATRGFRQDDFVDDAVVVPMVRGTSIADPSLDFCEATYPSEGMRIARRQVLVMRQNDDPYAFLSSEVVRYISSAAAQQAVQELDKAASTCTQNGGSPAPTGGVNAYRFKELPTALAIVPGVTRRAFFLQIGTAPNAQTLLLVYQFKDDHMSNLYVVKRGVDSLTPEEAGRWMDAATQLAKRM